MDGEWKGYVAYPRNEEFFHQAELAPNAGAGGSSPEYDSPRQPLSIDSDSF